MSLRRRFVLYLAVVHVLFAGVAILLLKDHRAWLLAVEAVFALSFTIGYALLRRLFGTLDAVRDGALYLNEADYSVRIRRVGQPELDALVDVYNRMLDSLREERVRLQEQHYLLGKVVGGSPSGFVTLDFDERVDFANASAERLVEKPAGELIGRRLDDVPAPLGEALLRLAPGGSEIIALSGGRRVRCHRGSFADRGFSRSFFLLEELTEELRLFEKAAYEKLIRMMSHEVNNSVGATNSLLHSCLNYGRQLRPEDRKDFEHALTVAIARTDKLSAFVRGFAEVVKLPAPRRESCDVRALLEEAAVLMRASCEARRIAWKWEVAEALPTVALDRAQMEQALVNILKNAMEAIGQDGTITVRLGRRDGRAFMAVEDSGCGFSPEVQAHLFTPFFSTKGNGQGLGLTLVQEVLTSHHFDYSLDGPPGGPTRFTILF